MALSQSDLDAIDAAIATGELTVEFNGRRVTYRSISELKLARAHVANVIATQAGTPTPGIVRFNFTTTRGY